MPLRNNANAFVLVYYNTNVPSCQAFEKYLSLRVGAPIDDLPGGHLYCIIIYSIFYIKLKKIAVLRQIFFLKKSLDKQKYG